MPGINLMWRNSLFLQFVPTTHAESLVVELDPFIWFWSTELVISTTVLEISVIKSVRTTSCEVFKLRYQFRNFGYNVYLSPSMTSSRCYVLQTVGCVKSIVIHRWFTVSVHPLCSLLLLRSARWTLCRR